MTTSAAKATVNRTNSRLSTGPTTAQGKAASAQNARTHGLTSARLVLTNEDAIEYEALRNGFAASSLAPVGPQEQAAFDEYLNSLWRLQRCRRTEVSVFNDCIQSILEADPALTPDEAMGRVFTAPDYQKKMGLFLRYQTAIERAVSRALKQLMDLQRDRREAEPAEPEQEEFASVETEASSESGQSELASFRNAAPTLTAVASGTPISPSNPPIVGNQHDNIHEFRVAV
jgi:hypothetical protein